MNTFFEYGRELSEKAPLFFEDCRKAYIECALWADMDEEEKHQGTVYDLVRDSYEKVGRDILQFLQKAEERGVDITKYDPAQVGHDIWLTRNGHGAGFWDRPEVYGEDDSEKLTEICKQLGSAYVYAINKKSWAID